MNKNMAARGAPIRADADSVAILLFPGTFRRQLRASQPYGGMGKKVAR